MILRELLTDVLYLNARTSLCDIWHLLDDFSSTDCDPDSNVPLYRAFIAKHAQTLSRHEGQLVALLHHEGFPDAKAQVNLAQSKGLYSHAWFETKILDKQPSIETGAQTDVLEMISCWEFQSSCAVDLAINTKIAFYVIKLGVVGIIDIEKACALNQLINIRLTRPLALFSSADGRYLVVAYENGEGRHLGAFLE